MSKQTTLEKLKLKAKAKIIGFNTNDTDMEIRLREIGFAEGDQVELIHKGLFGGSPLAIRLDGLASIAIRPQEASHICVELIEEP